MSNNALYLLRHGKTTAGSAYIGSTDVALTELGYKQMRASVDTFLETGQRWQLIISSPLQRCAKFAQQLAQEQGIELIIEKGLAEYHFGDWEHKTALEVMEQYPDKLEQFWSDPEQYPPNNGESLAQFSQRVDVAITDIKQQHGDKTVLVIAHGGVMRYLLSQEQQLPISSMLNFPVEHGQLLSIEF
ncbi:MAG: histidine phosphatase family protein [Oceanospirillaceae bacterium]